MTRLSVSRGVRHIASLLAALLLSGCATYSQTISPIQDSLAAGEPRKALVLLEQRQVPERDLPLHLLDKAMLLRLAGDFRESNASFEQAKGMMASLEAASASETAASFVVNDGSRSYVGEPFEQALLHTYAALNYLDLGDSDAARVEALQVDLRLQTLAEDEDGPLGTDPFARYLAGIVYEQRGELSDALISYRKAWEAYRAHGQRYPVQVPSFLEMDLLRLTAKLGLDDEHRLLRETFDRKQWPNAKAYAANGELVFFLHNGLAPIKRERITVIHPPVAPQMVSIALPYYQQRPLAVATARVRIGDRETRTETVENLNAIAEETLVAAMPGITARAVARAVSKSQLSSRASKENGLLGFVSNVAGLLTERADTRSWLTLPGEIQMARILAPPGNYRIKVELLSPKGLPVEVREFDVTLTQGQKQILSYHWIPPSAARSK